ncbi:MAG: hypothetical protein ACKO25_12825 [Cyanobium sp.]
MAHTASHATASPATGSPAAIDPAVEPLRRANPHRYRDVRPGHLAVVAGWGRPWFIGRVCDVTSRPWSRTPGFVQVINVDSGDTERIPAPWIVELMSDRGLGRRPLPA